jgi:hypothetical protein
MARFAVRRCPEFRPENFLLAADPGPGNVVNPAQVWGEFLVFPESCGRGESFCHAARREGVTRHPWKSHPRKDAAVISQAG